MLFLLIYSCGSNDDDDEITITPDSNLGEVTSVTTLGGSNNDSAQSVIATSDGGYAVLGFTQSNDGDINNKADESFDYWLLKFNNQNTLQWSKTYGGSEDDRGSSIIQTQDGGYAILGYTTSNDNDVTNNAGIDDFWLAKLDTNGNLQWEKSYGYSGIDRGIKVIQTTDSGFFITGILDVTSSNGEGDILLSSNKANLHAGGDYWGLKLNATGGIEWARYFGGNFTDTPRDVIQTEDNGFIIVGDSDSTDTDISNNLGSYDYWVVKVSASGTFEWEKSFGGNQIDEARAIVKSDNGNYIIAGDSRSISTNGAPDVWLIKIDTNGNLLWEKALGGSNFDVVRAMTLTQDNGYILAGSSRSNNGNLTENKGQNDAWVLNLDTNGDLKWQTSVGGSNVDFAYGIAQLNDGSYVAVGDSTSSDVDINQTNRGFTDLLIIRID